MNPHSAAIAQGLRSLRKLKAESLTYQQGEDSGPLPLAPCAPERRTFETAAGLIEIEVFDFLIGVDELLLDDTAIEPQRGDRITWEINGTNQVFELLDNDDVPCWEWSDSGHTQYRLHTKRIG